MRKLTLIHNTVLCCCLVVVSHQFTAHARQFPLIAPFLLPTPPTAEELAEVAELHSITPIVMKVRVVNIERTSDFWNFWNKDNILCVGLNVEEILSGGAKIQNPVVITVPFQHAIGPSTKSSVGEIWYLVGAPSGKGEADISTNIGIGIIRVTRAPNKALALPQR